MDIEAIRKVLGTKQKVPGRDFYEWKVGRYVLHVYTSPRSFRTNENILRHETVNVDIMEVWKSSQDNTFTNYIHIRDDEPFKSYEPIQYDIVSTSNGHINLGDGRDMPIHHLCELIRYLYRLSNLTAFE